MPQAKKKIRDQRPVEPAPNPETTERPQRGRWTGLIIATVVLVVALIVIGVGYYNEYMAPFKRVIITIDDTTIDMDYYLKRARLSGLDPIAVLEAITNEQLILLEAPSYGIEVTPEDIDRELRRMAEGNSGPISDSEFKEWYRQNLNQSGLRDAEYREIVASNMLTLGMQIYMATKVSTVGEQIHLHVIVLGSYEDAEEAKVRLEAGEDFADLAREVSVDEGSKEKGGDVGWVPRGVNDLIDYWAFDLDFGEVSMPIQLTEGTYHLLMVSEKDDARELDEDSLSVVRSMALDKWLLEIRKNHEISYNFNSEIYNWINWQLSKDQTDGTE